MTDCLKGLLNVSEEASSCFISAFISLEDINFGLVFWESCNLPFASGTIGRTRPQSIDILKTIKIN